MDIHRDIHVQHLDIYMWISHQDVDTYMDILRDIHVQHLDIYVGIWDIYMPSIIPQPLAIDPSHERAKIAAINVKVFVIDDDNL